MSRRKTPFQFLNEKKDGKQIVTLSGIIRKRYWEGDKCIDAKLLRDTLEGVTEDVTIRLNSNGGDVFEGVEMYNYLKDHPSHITVEVTGIAASAATFILAGADTAVMNVGTVVMIHEASTLCWGNKGDLKKVMEAMETIDQSILDIYTDRTGQSAEQIRQWMTEEKHFTADEAVKYGFADEVKKKSSSVDRADIQNLIRETVAQEMELYQSQLQIPVGQVAISMEPVPPQPEAKRKQKSLLNKLRKGE